MTTSDSSKSYASAAASNATTAKGSGHGGDTGFKTRQRPDAIRNSNIVAAKGNLKKKPKSFSLNEENNELIVAVADAVRTSLGPRGMDKMIQTGNGDVTITNDGATILKQMSVIHPAAKMVCSIFSLATSSNDAFFFLQLVELSKAQDIEAGDGTTTVVVIAGSLLDAASRLVAKGTKARLSTMKESVLHSGLHPTTIADAFEKAADKATEILRGISIPIELSDIESLNRSASTALNSKVKENSFETVRIDGFSGGLSTYISFGTNGCSSRTQGHRSKSRY